MRRGGRTLEHAAVHEAGNGADLKRDTGRASLLSQRQHLRTTGGCWEENSAARKALYNF